MRVSELPDAVSTQRSQYTKIRLGDAEVENSQLKSDEINLFLEEDGLRSFAKLLSIPSTFIEKLPLSLSQEVLNYFMNQNDDSPVILQHDGSSLEQAFDGRIDAIPPQDFVGVVGDVMDPDDRVSKWYFENGKLQVDVITDELAVEPRPGDVTKGGVRFIGHTSPRNQAPYVGTFMERLVCSNGMVVEEEDSVVSLRGRTVADLLSEMELAAQRILGGVDHRLQQWGELTEVTVENPEQMVHRLATENGVSTKIESRVMDRVPELEHNTMYDVVNLMTQMQNEEGVSERQVENLQLLGGRTVATGGDHRCPECLHHLG